MLQLIKRICFGIKHLVQMLSNINFLSDLLGTHCVIHYGTRRMNEEYEVHLWVDSVHHLPKEWHF